jgi:hypothetical protein
LADFFAFFDDLLLLPVGGLHSLEQQDLDGHFILPHDPSQLHYSPESQAKKKLLLNRNRKHHPTHTERGIRTISTIKAQGKTQ